ncbi:hypothetical protein [Mesoterricola sediminis]|nr:hypothetical protein [Mesoterricola sediminis]
MDQVVRKVAFDLTSDLVKLTPVDTGLARSNWFIDYQRNPSTGIDKVKSGAPSLQRAATFISTLKAGGVFYITNNVPYIMVLEYGSSNQAPGGMARITVARWQQVVDGAVKAGSQSSRMTIYRGEA